MFGSRVNDAFVVFNDFFAKCEPDTSTLVLRRIVQPCEELEDLLSVIGIKAYSVITELQTMIAAIGMSACEGFDLMTWNLSVSHSDLCIIS